MTRWAALLSLAVAFALPSLAAAQSPATYPWKPVRLIAPAAPGGNPDVLARMLAHSLSETFGRAFVVENMPGGGGIGAAVAIANAAPDGHTLFLGDGGAFAINPALNAKLPYRPLQDFTFVTALVAVPTVLVVHPTLQATTLLEFIALAKARPGQLNFGSAGNGSIHHLTMAILASTTGIEMLHVPYKGGSPLVAALLAGEVHAGFSGIPNVQQAIKAGKLRVLGISTARRSASMPGVPTLSEGGVSGFDVATTIGLQGPAGLNPELVAKLQRAAAKGLRDPDVAQRIANLGMEIVENGTEHYISLVRADFERYAAAAKAAGLKPQ
jgi:tripartite-type tricarboxylate transporter receptor subunit TctC